MNETIITKNKMKIEEEVDKNILADTILRIKKSHIIDFKEQEEIKWDDYEILEVEGKGSYGEVVKYFNRRERYFGAFKFMLPNGQGQIDEMMKEVTLMQEISKLNCPYLIKLRHFQFLAK